jgi:hypothetical protein
LALFPCQTFPPRISIYLAFPDCLDKESRAMNFFPFHTPPPMAASLLRLSLAATNMAHSSVASATLPVTPMPGKKSDMTPLLMLLLD